MGQNLIPRALAAIELSTLDDTGLHELAGEVALASKTSPLVLASSTMQTSVGLMATKDTALTTANKTVADDRAKLSVDISAEALVRSDLVGEIRSYITLVTNVARTPAEVKATGLPAAGPRQPRNTPPTIPMQINSKAPRTGHGKIVVSVYETGTTHYKYAAQQSVDGVSWTQLGVGLGKTRTVTGASGTKVWVRFAMVRGAQQSDWSTAILVTIP